MNKNKEIPLKWLLQGPAFVRFSTLVDLMGKSPADPEVKKAYSEMLDDPQVAKLICDVNHWEDQYPITRHNDAVHPLHKLVFAADIGIDRIQLKPAVEAILAHQSPEGPFQIRIAIPPVFGGDGIPKWNWVATDAPLILYSVLHLGVKNDQVMKGVSHVVAQIQDSGFPCFASSSMGKFRGPGRKGDPCPYANLIILRMLAEIPEFLHIPEAEKAVFMLLQHWQDRGKKKYYLFGIGTDFAKPKAPLIWYDIIHFVDTLSRFPSAFRDKRFSEVLDFLESAADEEGRLTPGSIWTKWKGWEFSQKKQPSFWLTFLFHRARVRQQKQNK